ncbi:MAG: hypothetical protein OEZ36_13160 [Spirochaetota bacterium]|nr:hypothetical protein [Spirochaetota bacterium]
MANYDMNDVNIRIRHVLNGNARDRHSMRAQGKAVGKRDLTTYLDPADVYQYTNNLKTTLYVASKKENTKMVKRLLDHGAMINDKSWYGIIVG